MSPDVYALKRFGGGSGSIVLDNVQCTGNESSLSNCSTLPVHDCEHSENAGVRCLSGINFISIIKLMSLDHVLALIELGSSCIDDTVQLVGGSSPYEGRVEICRNGEWKSVGDDGWGTTDARVVCRQLRSPTKCKNESFQMCIILH